MTVSPMGVAMHDPLRSTGIEALSGPSQVWYGRWMGLAASSPRLQCKDGFLPAPAPISGNWAPEKTKDEP
jgi:hypothetical protein